MTSPEEGLRLPTVRLLVGSAVTRAGLSAVLSAAGFEVQIAQDPAKLPSAEAWAEVWLLDDHWLTEDLLDDPLLEAPAFLADAPALVSVGSAAWAGVLAELYAAGVCTGGYAALPASATLPELVGGILGAAAGLAVLPPTQVGADLDEEIQDEEDSDGAFPATDISLTPRERDVLALLAEGLSNKRAARELNVSESTVKFHVQAIYSKLGVQSRTAAVTRGLQLGLVSI